MAFILDTKFNPFTYDELVRPAMEMTLAHQEVEKGLAELEAQAAEWESKANRETDPIAYAQAINYARDLRMQASNLARQGLTGRSRKQLYGMASRYNTEIKPIETAYTQREKDRLIQQQARAQDGTMLFSREASNTSLDAYIANPSLGFKSFSGTALQAMAASQAAKLAEELKSFGKTGKIDAYYDILTTKYGLSSDEISSFITDPTSPNANKALQAIMNETLKASGIEQWGNPQAVKDAIGYINMGLWQAVGKEASQINANFAAQEGLKQQHALGQIAAKGREDRKTYAANRAVDAKYAKANGKGDGDDMTPSNYLSAVGTMLTDAEKKEYRKQIKKFKDKGYLTYDKDGNITGITNGGIDAYRNTKVISANKDLQPGNQKVEAAQVYKRSDLPGEGGFYKTEEGTVHKTQATAMLQRKLANEKGKAKYGNTFNVESYDPEFYAFLNTLEEKRTGGKTTKAWYGQHEYAMGDHSKAMFNNLVKNAFSTPEGDPNIDLVGHKAITTNVQDTQAERLKTDLAYDMSGDAINTYKIKANGKWEVDDNIDKGELDNYRPQKIVTTATGRPMVELIPLQPVAKTSGSSKSANYTEDKIYVPLPVGGHYDNYRNAVKQVFVNSAVLEQYNKEIDETGKYSGNIADVTEAYLNTNLYNPKNLIFLAEDELSRALSAVGGTNINYTNDGK